MICSKTSLRRAVALLAWAACCASSLDSRGDTPPTVSDVALGIQKAEGVLLGSGGFLVRCQRVKSEVVTPSRYGGGYLNVEFLVAGKNGRWVVHKHFLGNDPQPIDPEVFLPPKPLTIAAKDGLMFQWQQSSPAANVCEFGSGGNLYQCLDYFTHLGFDIARAIAQSNKADYEKIRKVPASGDYLDHPFLPEYLEEHASEYRVRPAMESVDDAPCWVVEYPSMDAIWVDPARGYAVLRRIYHWGPGKPRKFEIHNRDLKEVAPGLWLPFTQVVDKYASIVSEDRTIWDKVTSRMEYRVDEAIVGSVPDKVFEISIPEGLLVWDDARGIEYRVPAPNVDPFTGPNAEQWRKLRSRLQGWSRWRSVVIVVNVIVVLLVAIFFWRKRLGRKNQAGSLILAAVLGGLGAPGAAQAEERPAGLETKGAARDDGMEEPAGQTPGESFRLFLREGSAEAKERQKGVFCWKPEWRTKGDCGPCALFILMALTGHEQPYSEVKRRISIDPDKGCSMMAMRQAAAELGFPVEVRFVNPKDITKIPRPCIIHGIISVQSGVGHFLILVDYHPESDTFDVIDPDYERFSPVKADSLLSTFSGYTIVSAERRWSVLERMPGWLLLLPMTLAAMAMAWTFVRRSEASCAAE